MVISRDVIFDEKAILYNTKKEEKQDPKSHGNDECVV